MLLGLYAAAAVSGGLLAVRGRGWWRVAGALLLLEALLALGAQVALSTLSPGLGEPYIRVALAQTLTLALGGAAALAAATGLVVAGVRWGRQQRRRGAVALLVTLPLLAAAAMAAMVFASTPERERERDPLRRQISLPPGFSANIYARSSEWDNPTVMAFGPDGKLYVGDINGGLWVVSQPGGPDTPATIRKLAANFTLLLGLVWHDGELFVASQGKIEALRDSNGDGSFEQRRLVVGDLPAMVLRPHSNNSLTFGPDGRLYFGVGSTTNGDYEPNPLAASVLSVRPDGSDLRVFARGFGNTFAVAFNRDGAMFGGDNSNGQEPDEFNQIEEGGHYGYPYFYGDPPKNNGTIGALVTFPAHSAPTGVAFYSGTRFPVTFQDNAFLTLWATGELRRVEVARTAGGAYLARATTFASGFLNPVGVVVGPDGDLYVADFGTSAIYRITYQGVP
jgi:glucose/arabinose dehydrogenase